MFDFLVTPEKVQARLLAKLGARFPEGIPWHDPDFLCLTEMHDSAQKFFAVNEFEYQLSDGGWGQFLVECFGTWRQILSLAEQAYREMPSEAGLHAVEEVRDLCAASENECFTLFSGGDAYDDQRSAFLVAAYSARFAWEREFWSARHYEKRLAWISQNKQSLLHELRK